MVRNECFRVAMDYLFKNGLIADQAELSKLTGISETSISRILNNRVKEPSEATIRKLNDAFGNIFNPEYFRGKSVFMLVEDEMYYSMHPEENPFKQKKAESTNEQSNQNDLPAWADNLIGIMSEQVKQNEALNRELRQSIAEVHALRDELRSMLRSQYEVTAHPIPYHATAEP